MRIVAISDTHSMHDRINVPDGDVLVHAGDFTGGGESMRWFVEWLGELPHKHKIVIAGNHDWGMFNYREEREELFTQAGVVYLQDSGVEIDGVKFYGAPWQPEFMNWAFNLPRGQALKEVWAKIPKNTDVLVTHGPPNKILDLCPDGHVGCEELREAVLNLPDLKAHIFGHIHEGYGTEKHRNTTFINASCCDGAYIPLNPPIVFDYEGVVK
jgi:Icc-related predicted phosphoesterase